MIQASKIWRSARHSLMVIGIFAASIFFAAAGPRAALGQEPKDAAQSTSLISGRVTVGGKPAAGVAVMAHPFTQESRQTFQMMMEGMPIFKATTDHDGNYRITNLAAGPYSISTHTPSLIASEDAKVSAQGKPITLGQGETVEGVDFALMAGGVITGRVTNKDGRPVVHERINLMAVDAQGQKKPVPMSEDSMFHTDDRGVFRVYGLPAGRYIVSIGRTGQNGGAGMEFGMRRTNHVPTYHPGVTDLAKAAAVEVQAGGEVANVDIRLGVALTTYKAFGRIIDADTGKPIPEAMVAYAPLRTGDQDASISGIGSPPNARGEFQVEGLTAGRYRAYAFFSPTGESELYSDAVEFEVKTEDVRGLAIKARRGGSISGVAIIEGTNDAEVIARLSHVELFANVMSSETGGMAAMARGKVSADGSFRISGLRPGKVRIFLNDFLSSTGFALVRTERNGAPQKGGIQVGAGENVSGVNLILAHASGVIRGQVRVENGTLPKGALMIVYAVPQVEGQADDDDDKDEDGSAVIVDQEQGFFDMVGSPRSATVDGAGRFVIEGLVPGRYVVTLSTMLDPSSGDSGQKELKVGQHVIVGKETETEVTIVVDLRANR